MSWREYQLRRIGYIRQEKEEWKRTRMVSYYSLVASGAIDTRKMSIEQFMPLDGKSKSSRMTDSGRNALKEARRIYLEQLNGSRT